EVGALEELHHHEGDAALERAHVEDLCNMLACEVRGGPRLPQKARDGDLVRRDRRLEQLDRDRPAELPVKRGDDDAHPAHAEDAVDEVFAGDHLAPPGDPNRGGLWITGHTLPSPKVARRPPEYNAGVWERSVGPSVAQRRA